MKKLKPIAYELLSIKKEMLNDAYPEVVKKALEITVDQMFEKRFIDLEVQLYVKDNSYTYENLESFLNETDEFKKSKEELIGELKNLIEEINNNFYSNGLKEDEIYCNIDLEDETIKICKVFSLDNDFMKQYFYMEDKDDSYFNKLMKKKGFLETFAMLRLPKIIYSFIDLCPLYHNFSLEKTCTYFEANKEILSIDLVFSVKLDVMENDTLRIVVLDEINEVIKQSIEYFEEKMSI